MYLTTLLSTYYVVSTSCSVSGSTPIYVWHSSTFMIWKFGTSVACENNCIHLQKRLTNKFMNLKWLPITSKLSLEIKYFSVSTIQSQCWMKKWSYSWVYRCF